MRHSLLFPCLLLVLLCGACTPPVEAPESLRDLTLFLYANFDSETGEELLNFTGHAHGVISVVYSPCGRRIAGDSMDGFEIGPRLHES